MKLRTLVAVFALAGFVGTAQAQECSSENWKACKGKPWVIGNTMDTPIGDKWWPHKLWGANDEAGATNWYTKPDVVQRALASAKERRVYSLGRPYIGNQPGFAGRQFVMRIIGTPTGGPAGSNMLVYHDEFVSGEIGQTGTQFDGLGHIGVAINGAGDKNEMRYYNGFSETEIGDAYGLKKLGTEKLHPIVARGILIDAAAARQVVGMEAGQEITMADVRTALKHQGMENFKFQPGDVVLFRTNWGRHWIQDNPRYNGGAPGIGVEVATWLSDTVQAGVVGADNWPVEVVPNPDGACVFCVHTHLITRHGILLQENMDLEALAHDKVYTFLYVYSPTPVAGAAGSIGAPLAIK
jgi:kynurenine formamidase